MAVSLAKAKASALALYGSVDQVINNATLHDNNHWSKEKAVAAVAGGKHQCGYYWHSSTKQIWTHKTTNAVVETRPGGKGKAKKYTMSYSTAYRAINVNDCWNILSHALKNSNGDGVLFVRGNTETRFVVGTSFPANFGGETIKNVGGPEACTYVAIAIETAPNAAIVTHFPAADSYFANKTDLV